MKANPNRSGRPTTLADQLGDDDTIVQWLAELTAAPPNSIRHRLNNEHRYPGFNVSRCFHDTGLQRYTWSDDMRRFYGDTDAFLYELVVWNRNRLKRRMRRKVEQYLSRNCKPGGEVLFIGDGLGFDSLYLAQLGYRVTYYEMPGYSERFARKVFDAYPERINVVTDAAELGQGCFDAVVCLDVLEHIPDPAAYLSQISSYLRNEGVLIVHSPFYMIHPTTPTHLKANRRYSGDMSLYRRCGFRLIDGDIRWNPLVFRKGAATRLNWRLWPKLFAIRVAGVYLAMGRFSVLPFWWVYRYRNKWNMGFDHPAGCDQG